MVNDSKWVSSELLPSGILDVAYYEWASSGNTLQASYFYRAAKNVVEHSSELTVILEKCLQQNR